MFIRWLIGIGIIVGLLFNLLFNFLFNALPAAANAPAPPPHMWFRFQDANAQSVSPEAVQLTVCRTQTCEQPILLMQSGSCTQAGCVQLPPALKAPHRFDCAESTCLYAESVLSDRPTGTTFKLIAKLQNRVLSSPPFASEFRSTIASRGARDRTVMVEGDQLRVIPNSRSTRATRWELFSRALAITQTSELVVALIVLRWLPRPLLTHTLAMIGFANLLTFPVVWLFFPALQPFQYSASRVFGGLSLAIAVFFSVFLTTRKVVTPKILVKTFIVWVVSLPFFLALGFGVAVFLGYGEFLPPVGGLPRGVTLSASEVFAGVWEAWLVRCISRDFLTVWQAGVLTTLTNGVSLLLGLVLLPPVQ